MSSLVVIQSETWLMSADPEGTPTLRRQTGMESERGEARTRARNPLFRVQCLRAHPYGRKEALIAKVRQRTDVARADQAGQARL